MAANRIAPSEATDPSGLAGDVYAAQVKEEIDALWDRVNNEVGTIGGTADAITGVCSPPLIAAPADGQRFRLTPGANNTGAVTVNLDGFGAISLRDVDGSALVADDLVSGRPVEFVRHGSAGNLRLVKRTERAAVAEAIAGFIQIWEQIGDTTVGGAVASIEHTFTASAYSAILVVFSGMRAASTANTLSTTLRTAGAALVTLALGAGAIDTGAGTEQTGRAEFYIDLITETHHYGNARGVNWNGTAFTAAEAVGGNGDAPDRIRVAYTSGNISAGRVMTYGLKH